MRIISQLTITLVCAVLLCMAGGCGSSAVVHPVEEKPTAPLETISFGDLQPVLSDQVITPQSAKDLIQLGVVLSSQGRHTSAARVYLEAAELTAPDGRFRQACLGATATEYVLAGDRDSFKRTLATLKEGMTEYERLNPSPEVEVLLLLDNYQPGAGLRDELDRLSRQIGGSNR